MFMVKHQLIVSRALVWKGCRSLSSSGKRNMLPNSIDNYDKRNKLGNNQTLAQASGGGSSDNRGPVPALQAQGSINTNKKGKRSQEQPPAGLHQQNSLVLNPFYKLFALHQCFTADNVQHRQLSNVSVNRNAKAGTGSTRKHAGSTVKFNESIGSHKRRWQKVRREEQPPGQDFTLMSYNVLSQDLLDKHPELYRNHTKANLQWNYRWNRLMAEIRHHNSDIVCLQEVQESHLDDYYIENMTSLGYESIYKKRTGDCPDGCAIFYKWDVFKLIEHTSVEFHQLNSELLDRDNVGLIAKFAPLKNISAEFVVATTHLLYNPRRDDVRVAQMQLFLTEIDRMAYKKMDGALYTPIILTGDFNSLPTSFPLNFINFASLNYNSLPRKKSSGQNQEWIPTRFGITDDCKHYELQIRRHNTSLSREDELGLVYIQNSNNKHNRQNHISNQNAFKTGYLKHGFIFKSVYNHSFAGQTEATTYQDQWITVDYIFYSSRKSNSVKVDDKLLLLSRYLLPISGQLDGVTIPNKNLGSDHLALVAKFRLSF